VHFDEVNFLAVGLATVLTFVLGGLWYSPLLFARPWMAGHGYTEESMKAMQSGMARTYAISFVCWFVMTTVLALIAPHFGEGVGSYFHIGILVWLGFSATTGLTNNLFSDKPLAVWLIDAGYQIASIAIMSVVLGLWP
jgi:hypothetical protein